MAVLKLFRRAFEEWMADNPSLIAAGLAFFSIFSIAPLLLLAVTVTGQIFRQADAQALVAETVAAITSPRAAQALDSLVNALRASGDAGSIFGFILLVWAASRVVNQLQGSLRIVWKAAPTERQGLRKWGGLAANRARAMLIALGFQLILLGFLVVDLVLAGLKEPLLRYLPETLVTYTLPAASFSASLVIFTLMFAMVYRWLPETRLPGAAIFAGAAVSSVLFTLGRYGLTLYFRLGDFGSASSVAGSVVIMLLWVYFSAHVFLFGAEFAWVYAHRDDPAAKNPPRPASPPENPPAAAPRPAERRRASAATRPPSGSSHT